MKAANWMGVMALALWLCPTREGAAMQGILDRQDTRVVWFGSYVFGSTTRTNTTQALEVLVPLNYQFGAYLFEGTVKLTAPGFTPSATPSWGGMIVKFDPLLVLQTTLEGQWTLTNAVPDNQLVLENSVINTDTAPSQLQGITNGPPLGIGVYPVLVTQEGKRTQLWQESENENEAVYSLGTQATVALRQAKTTLIVGQVEITSYYRFPKKPYIRLYTTSLQYWFSPSDTQPASQEVLLDNIGGADFEYTLTSTTTSGRRWLTPIPDAGTFPSGLTNFLVQVNPLELEAGTNQGTITLTGNAMNGPFELSVQAIVMSHTQTNSQPKRLSIARSGTQVIVSWPAVESWKLQTTASIFPPISWQPESLVPVKVEDRYQITVSPSATARYYRLE
jgi:hypothetical protein